MPGRLSSGRVILAGFAGVAVFSLVMLGIGLSRLSEINAQMEELANRSFRRAEAVYAMRLVARDRLASLQSMFFLEDPFERDAERLRYDALAVDFITARDSLLALAPSAVQRSVWQQARSLIVADERLHARALEALFEGGSAQAARIIQNEILPLEARLKDTLDRMLAIERAEMTHRVADTTARYRTTWWLLVALAMMSLVMTVATAVYVTRRASRNEARLRAETERAEAAAEKLAWAAAHDVLTGLSNRRTFEACLRALAASASDDRTVHALAYLDLDRFKPINDRHGHDAGDALLQEVCRVMQDQVRADDVLARLGGDEFGLLMPHCDLEEANRIVERIVEAVKACGVNWNGQILSVGLSAGVVAVDPAVPITELVRRADQACYAAKAGRAGNRSGGAA